MEIWKDIPNYEGFYQVSNLGRVKSLLRFDSLGRSQGGLILVFELSKRGYYRIGLTKNKKQIKFSAHRLVVLSFIGEIKKGLVVDHIDNDKLNNNLSNLQIITHRENSSKDRKGLVLSTGVQKTKSGKYKSAIRIKGRVIHLGVFISEIDASIIYKKALKHIDNVDYILSFRDIYINKVGSTGYRGVTYSKIHKVYKSFKTIKGKRHYIGQSKNDPYSLHLKYINFGS